MNVPSPDSPPPQSAVFNTKRLEVAALAAIIVFAVVLRFWAIDFGFPEHVRPDEQYFVGIVHYMDGNSTLDPNWYYYPSFYMYVNLAVWRAYTLCQFFGGHYRAPDPDKKEPPTIGLSEMRVRSPDRDYLLGRCVTALFGFATVLLVYGIARRFFGRKAAVAAAALLAVNGLHTLNSHFYKSDVATTFFTVAALGCMACYVQTRCARWNLAAAVTTGLAASTNYYGGFLIVPLVASQLMALYAGLVKASAGPGDSLAAWRGVAVMPAVALAVFALTSPYCLIRWTDFLNTFHRMVFMDRQALYDTMASQTGFSDHGFQTGPWAYSFRFCYRYSLGLVLGMVAAAGLVTLLVRRRALGGLLVMFFVIHFLGTASGRAVFMRYYLSLVPVLVIGAGALLAWLVQRIAPLHPGRQAALMAVAIALCGFEGLWTSVNQDRLLAREDTRVEAREWIAKQIPAGALVGTPVDWWGDYYRYGKPTLPDGRSYVPVTPAQVNPKRIRYLVVDDYLLRLYSPPARADWTAWLERNAKLLHEVSPYDRPVEEIRARYDQLDAFYLPIARFAGVKRPGPRIRIYAVQPR